MDFELTADQRAVQTLARARGGGDRSERGLLGPRAQLSDELFPKLAELGLMGVCVPEEYGGAGADFLSYVLVLEELSRADAGVGVTVAVHTSATTLPILTFGSEEQRSRFVPPLARGEQLGHSRSRSRAPDPMPGHCGRRRSQTRTAGGSPARSSGSRTDRERAHSSSSPEPIPQQRGARHFVLRARRRPRPGDAGGGEARPQLVGDVGPRARRRAGR